MINKLITPFVLLALFSCKKESMNCGVACTYEEELLFQTGFEQTVLTNDDWSKVNLSGVDPAFASNNSWEELNNRSDIGTAQISYEDGEDDQRIAEILPDPENPSNSVMSFKIMEPHIKEGTKKKGRVQLNVNQNQCIREIYQTVKLRLHPDMAYLKNWEKRVYWLSLFEFWNNADWTKEKYPFRVTVNLFKDEEGAVSDMYFHVKGDYKKNCKTCKWQKEWEETGSNFSVPFGQWMEIEIYLKEGDAENGRFYMTVTPEGGTKTIVFNLTRTTQHPKETCPDGFSHFQPMKLYTSDELIDYMSAGDKKLQVYWDDWNIYKNKSF